jgi:hypothetical protein
MFDKLFSAFRSHKSTACRVRHTFHPRVERLEVRWSPAVVADHWIGVAGQDAWYGVGTNWSTGAVPIDNVPNGTFYDVYIDAANSKGNCKVTGTPNSFSIHSLHITTGLKLIIDTNHHFTVQGNKTDNLSEITNGGIIQTLNTNAYIAFNRSDNPSLGAVNINLDGAKLNADNTGSFGTGGGLCFDTGVNVVIKSQSYVGLDIWLGYSAPNTQSNGTATNTWYQDTASVSFNQVSSDGGNGFEISGQGALQLDDTGNNVSNMTLDQGTYYVTTNPTGGTSSLVRKSGGGSQKIELGAKCNGGKWKIETNSDLVLNLGIAVNGGQFVFADLGLVDLGGLSLRAYPDNPVTCHFGRNFGANGGLSG